MCGVWLSEVSSRDFGLPRVDAMVGLLAGAASVAWGPLQQGGEHRCGTHALGLRVPAESIIFLVEQNLCKIKKEICFTNSSLV